jgi:hypothetical protein
MSESTREIATELQDSLSAPQAEMFLRWMEGMRADLAAVAAEVDADGATSTDCVGAITNITE